MSVPDVVDADQEMIGGGITVKNENLFSMMKMSAERDSKQ